MGLLVPPEANQTHLNLLAQLAKLMADENFRNYINESSNADELFERLTKLTTVVKPMRVVNNPKRQNIY
ncbi:MAG: PTS sugar transporter subunit IIA [Arenicellales bacterium WSBS_2016_MAG_OTU3]